MRPFVHDDVTLQGSGCGAQDDDVRRFLEARVEELRRRAVDEHPDAPPALRSQPLVRLKAPPPTTHPPSHPPPRHCEGAIPPRGIAVWLHKSLCACRSAVCADSGDSGVVCA